ncbi:DUF4864 domain-containing protein [Haloarcula sp. CBA1130]|uniref:DUF4864 domain-containing protein n=1 Tax=unclassified Haloarcula TaxID=2624677 RepID=UPI001246C7E4|nr:MULTISPECIES: DUF4864 domain-containing protein [unclassified Haloarcula]KAA9396165.1 DUF4864 domain-containing protein [Haloarcula sp. CBA1129]KAA9400306.1 DUF4864 domain-containing protein [Haloarcula sp. CBA1130]
MSEREYPVASLPTPSETYSPDEAIAIQLAALETNGDPYENAGIMTAYNFAAPANRRSTGPLDRLIAMVRSPQYRPMLNFAEAVRGPVERNGNYADQRVTITGPGGRTVTYEFGLSVQSVGEFRGCWQTDRVVVI